MIIFNFLLYFFSKTKYKIIIFFNIFFSLSDTFQFRNRVGRKTMSQTLLLPFPYSLRIRASNRAGRAGPIMGWAKTGPGQNWPSFSGQNFSSPARPKNRAGWAK